MNVEFNKSESLSSTQKSGDEYDTIKVYYNPKSVSPNTFIRKLERRMVFYGEDDFNDFSSFSLLNDEKNDFIDIIKK